MPPSAQTASTVHVDDLERRIRNLRRWVIALGAALGVTLLLACALASVLAAPVMLVSTLMAGSEGPWGQASGPDTSDELRDEITAVYKESLTSVEVKRVSVVYEDEPALLGMGGEPAYAVEYRLKGSPVTIANVVSEFDGNLVSSGLLPPKGTLKSKLDPNQLITLLKAWDKHSPKPFGGVLRYDEALSLGSDFDPSVRASQPDEIVVGETTYKTSDLWVVFPGRTASGSKVKAEMMDSGQTVSVFHIDRKAGRFRYVGEETGIYSPVNPF